MSFGIEMKGNLAQLVLLLEVNRRGYLSFFEDLYGVPASIVESLHDSFLVLVLPVQHCACLP